MCSDCLLHDFYLVLVSNDDSFIHLFIIIIIILANGKTQHSTPLTSALFDRLFVQYDRGNTISAYIYIVA